MQGNFPDYTVESSEDEEKGTFTVSAVKNWTTGFDIDSIPESQALVISFQSQLRMVFLFGAIAASIVVTMLFGREILSAMNLVADAGTVTVTLRILYIIPLLIFMIPSVALFMFISAKINPKDTELLESVKAILNDAGLQADVD